MVKTEFHLHFGWDRKRQESETIRAYTQLKVKQVKQVDKLYIFLACLSDTVWKVNILGLKEGEFKTSIPRYQGPSSMCSSQQHMRCQAVNSSPGRVPGNSSSSAPTPLASRTHIGDRKRGFHFVLTLTKLSGNKPLLPLICPSHQPPSSFLMLVMISPTVIVSSSSCWAW